MSWAYERLGLSGTPTVRDVKRAYARLLKETRPEDDQQAFQDLRAAYEAALQWAQRAEEAPAQAGPEPEPVLEPVLEPEFVQAQTQTQTPEWEPEPVPVPVRKPVVAPVPPLPALPTGDEIAQATFVHAASCRSAEEVHHWLVNNPDLLNLELKHDTARALEWAIVNWEQPVFAECLDAVWSFFDLDQVPMAGATLRAQAYSDKRHELSVRWLLKEDNRAWALHSDNQHVLESMGGSSYPKESFAPMMFSARLESLSVKRGLWSNVLRSLRWGEPDSVMQLYGWLSAGGRYNVVPPLDADQIRFWSNCADGSKFSVPRAARYLATYLVAAIVAALLVFFVNMEAPKHGGPSFFANFLEKWADVASLCAGLWVLNFVWKPLSAWQALPEWQLNQWVWAHTLCVPSFVLMGWLVFAVAQMPLFGVVIWVWGYWLMKARFANRLGIGFTLQWRWWWIFLAVPLLKVFALLMAILAAVGPIVALSLLALWAYELYRSRPLAAFR
jgi:hypothetical protein